MKKSFLKLPLLFLFSFFFLSTSGCPDPDRPDPDAGGKRLEAAEQAYAANPGDPAAAEDLLLVLMQKATDEERAGDYAAAAETYRRAGEVNPDKLFVRLGRGRSLIRSGRVDEGVKELESIIDRNPSLSAGLYEVLAEGYEKQGHIEEARKAWLKVLAINPAQVKAYRELARLEQSEGLTDQAGRSQAQADDLARYGYPDRGYRDRPLEEWIQESRPGWMSAAQAGNTTEIYTPPPEAHQPGKKPGPNAAKKTLALYNVFTYLDRERDPQDLFAAEKATKAGYAYLQRSKGVESENAYRDLIKRRVKDIKNEKKELIRKYGLQDVEGTMAKLKDMSTRLHNLQLIISKSREQATAKGDQELTAKIDDLETRLAALDPEALDQRIQGLIDEARRTMKQRVKGELSDEDLKLKGQHLATELAALRQQTQDQGIVDLDQSLMTIAAELKIRLPKHGGESGED